MEFLIITGLSGAGKTRAADVLEDLDWARAHYRRVGRIFLCDGDALCLSNNKLLTVLDRIREYNPDSLIIQPPRCPKLDNVLLLSLSSSST